MGMDAATLARTSLSHSSPPRNWAKAPDSGLATIYGIVKQSNGYIGVESVPGKGASLSEIYLPRYAGEMVVEKPTFDPEENLHGSESIVLVEDAEPLKKLAQAFLESGGFRVLSAGSGEEALSVASRFGDIFDLLLTDVVIMPGMNGRVLAEQLSARQPGMKVLYMSGYTDSLIAAHGALDPGTYLLHKPFPEEVLIRKVREVIDSGNTPSSVTNRAAHFAT